MFLLLLLVRFRSRKDSINFTYYLKMRWCEYVLTRNLRRGVVIAAALTRYYPIPVNRPDSLTQACFNTSSGEQVGFRVENSEQKASQSTPSVS